MIIGLTGKRGTGKDTVADYLVRRYGYKKLDFTKDVLAPVLRKAGKPVTRDNLIELAMNGRRKAHNGIWAERLAGKIKKKGKAITPSQGSGSPRKLNHSKGSLVMISFSFHWCAATGTATRGA